MSQLRESWQDSWWTWTVFTWLWSFISCVVPLSIARTASAARSHESQPCCVSWAGTCDWLLLLLLRRQCRHQASCTPYSFFFHHCTAWEKIWTLHLAHLNKYKLQITAAPLSSSPSGRLSHLSPQSGEPRLGSAQPTPACQPGAPQARGGGEQTLQGSIWQLWALYRPPGQEGKKG